jgi:hypothetical protein
MGHLLLLQCAQRFHTPCTSPTHGKGVLLLDLKKVPEISQMPIKQEIFKSYFPILFRKDPIVFGLFTARFLNDNMFFPMTLLGRI